MGRKGRLGNEGGGESKSDDGENERESEKRNGGGFRLFRANDDCQYCSVVNKTLLNTLKSSKQTPALERLK
jgi:hypothetical protein